MLAFLTVNDKKLQLVLTVTFLSYCLLLALFAYLCINNDDHSWKLFIFQSLPLLLLLPGLFKQHYRAYSWMCFVILAYFTAYVVEVGSPIGDIYDWLGLILSVIIFSGAMMASRWLQRENSEK